MNALPTFPEKVLVKVTIFPYGRTEVFDDRRNAYSALRREELSVRL
jgi:hypothetical protein